MEENAIFGESLEAKTTALHRSWQNLANDVLPSGLIGGALTVLTKILELLDTDIGVLLTRTALFTGVFYGGTSLIKAMHFFAESVGGAKSAIGKFSASLQIANGKILLITAALSAAIAAGIWFWNTFGEKAKTMEELAREIDQNNESLVTARERLQEINNTPWYDRTPEILKEKESLEELIKAYEKTDKKLADRLKRATSTSGVFDIETYMKYGGDMNKLGENEISTDQVAANFDDIYGNLTDQLAGVTFEMLKNEEVSDELITAYNELIEDGSEYFETLRWMADNQYDLSQEQLRELTIYEDAIKIYEKKAEAARNLAEEQELLATGIKLTSDQVQVLTSENEAASDSIKVINDESYISVNALADLTKSGSTAAAAILQVRKAAIETKLSTLREEIAGAKSSFDELAASAGRAYAGIVMAGQAVFYGAQEKLLEEQLATIEDAFANITVSVPSAGGGGGSKDVLSDLQEQIDQFNHQVFLFEKDGQEKHANEIIKIYTTMQDLIHAKAEELRTLGYAENSKEIRQLQELWWGLADDINAVYDSIIDHQKDILEDLIEDLEGQANAYEVYASMMVDYIDEMIAGYQKEIDALDEANEQLNEQIELEEKLDDLARARSTKVMVYKDGRFQYVQDIDKVSSAAGALEDYQRKKQLENEKKYWQDKIDQLNEYKNSWQNFTSDYEYYANMQILIQSGLFSQEDLIFKNRLNSAQDFANQYMNIMQQIQDAQDQIEDLENSRPNAKPNASPDWSELWWEAENNPNLTDEQREALQDYYHQQKEQEMAGSGQIYDPGTGEWRPAGSSGGSGNTGAGSGNQGNFGVVGGNGNPGTSNGSTRPGGSPPTGTGPGGSTGVLPGVRPGGAPGLPIGTFRPFKKAQGTLSAEGGITQVGELGPELRVLNQGDGIIPAHVTKTLWDFGANPVNYLQKLSNTLTPQSSGDVVSINQVVLPNVENPNDFAKAINTKFWITTVQNMSKTR